MCLQSSSSLCCGCRPGKLRDLAQLTCPKLACMPAPCATCVSCRYYNIHDVCKTVKAQSPKLEVFKSAIINAGFRCVEHGSCCAFVCAHAQQPGPACTVRCTAEQGLLLCIHGLQQGTHCASCLPGGVDAGLAGILHS